MKDIFKDVDGLPSLRRGKVRIDWVNLGEGYSGDYNPKDIADKNLLRFDVYRKDGGRWSQDVSDGSCCTLTPADTKRVYLKQGLKIIMDAIYGDIESFGHAKRACERMSWIGPTVSGKMEVH